MLTTVASSFPVGYVEIRVDLRIRALKHSRELISRCRSPHQRDNPEEMSLHSWMPHIISKPLMMPRLANAALVFWVLFFQFFANTGARREYTMSVVYFAT